MARLSKLTAKALDYFSGNQSERASTSASELPVSWFDLDRAPEKGDVVAQRLDVTGFMVGLGLEALVDKGRFRFPRQKEQKDLLPAPDKVSTAAAINRLAQYPERVPEGTRRSMENQQLLLQRAFGGRPEILLWHALAISYLRRDTPHTEKAADLFFKIWDEQAEWMAANLNGRWLISALQTFADHGREADEARCGAVGYVYGSLIKIYECEIASAYDRKPDTVSFRGGAVPGLFEFQPGDDILFNLNTLVVAQGKHAGPAGYALGSLIAQVKASQSVFERTDALATGRADAFLAFTGKRRSR